MEPRNTEILRRKLDLEGKFVYGFLGRIVDRKGIRELYEAFCKVYEQDKNCRLLIVDHWEFSQIADKTLYNKMMAHEGIVMPGRTG